MNFDEELPPPKKRRTGLYIFGGCLGCFGLIALGLIAIVALNFDSISDHVEVSREEIEQLMGVVRAVQEETGVETIRVNWQDDPEGGRLIVNIVNWDFGDDLTRERIREVAEVAIRAHPTPGIFDSVVINLVKSRGGFLNVSTHQGYEFSVDELVPQGLEAADETGTEASATGAAEDESR